MSDATFSASRCAPKVNAAWLVAGAALRRARVDRGGALAEAARRAGVSPRTLGDIEHGRADPALLDWPPGMGPVAHA